ncbi:MAG: aminotransferase class V-fold PLP-dependent enzyme [Bacteroidota bacterium]|nr:aminotransferase class V-fold PLP-dependent enzyme [Bacteroidota bacterium]
MSLEQYFEKYRKHVIGIDTVFETPFGNHKMIYADWVASGRLYAPIEKLFFENIFPFVGNTHTETSTTGATMSIAFSEALKHIKLHVNADKNDVIISSGAGMTMLVNKFQRILGLKIHETFKEDIKIHNKPIVFITHMEHHSNQTSWLETIADVQIIPHQNNGEIDLEAFESILAANSERKLKIAAITSCSNVTGVVTPYYKIAEIMHNNNGLCFVDFACSAPYINIDMHPKNPKQRLDAIYFSPHKFLGGPGSTGILIFNRALYNNKIPDNPGGGTVDWTNPWGEHKYIDNIEIREDGGTPAFLQTIKTSLCIKLKEQMGVKNIIEREHEIQKIIWNRFANMKQVNLLAENIQERLGVYSFYINDVHYNLIVQLLNDRYGIQVRGGCSCAGTYGHILLNVNMKKSNSITNAINKGDLSEKPGWVRISIHPVMTDEEINFIMDAIEEISNNHSVWIQDYNYDKSTNAFIFNKKEFNKNIMRAKKWFESSLS